MPSSKERVECLVELLNIATSGNVSSRPMMGEYVVYYRDKVIGGVYDDRFLLKPTESAKVLLPNAERQIPYEGAKEMLLIDDFENAQLIRELLESMYPELPARKPRKKRREQRLAASGGAHECSMAKHPPHREITEAGTGCRTEPRKVTL